jgi:hypothetical protein
MSTRASNPGWTDETEVTAVASSRGLAARLLQKEQEIALLRIELAQANERLMQLCRSS